MPPRKRAADAEPQADDATVAAPRRSGRTKAPEPAVRLYRSHCRVLTDAVRRCRLVEQARVEARSHQEVGCDGRHG